MAKTDGKNLPSELQQVRKTPAKTLTLPDTDRELIGEIQSRGRKHDVSLNDSEVVRAGLAALKQISDKQFLQIIKSLIRLKRGRPSTNNK